MFAQRFAKVISRARRGKEAVLEGEIRRPGEIRRYRHLEGSLLFAFVFIVRGSGDKKGAPGTRSRNARQPAAEAAPRYRERVSIRSLDPAYNRSLHDVTVSTFRPSRASESSVRSLPLASVTEKNRLSDYLGRQVRVEVVLIMEV